MQISVKQYCKDVAGALLNGYFLGVLEERKRWLNRRQRRKKALEFKRKGASGRR